MEKSSIGKAGVKSTARRAKQYAEDPERTRELLGEAMEKASRQKGRLSGVWDSLMILIRLVRAWLNGTYRSVPWQSVVLAIAAFIYFIMPFDIVPDFILGIGYMDDASVIAYVLKSISDDVDAFMRWEHDQEAG